MPQRTHGVVHGDFTKLGRNSWMKLRYLTNPEAPTPKRWNEPIAKSDHAFLSTRQGETAAASKSPCAAEVRFVRIPAPCEGDKCGIDDYLVDKGVVARGGPSDWAYHALLRDAATSIA
jgi:hypothetical protein